jgi:hypothetical protein
LAALAAGVALVTERALAEVVVVDVKASYEGFPLVGTFYFNPVGRDFGDTPLATSAQGLIEFTTSSWAVSTTNMGFVGVSGTSDEFSAVTSGSWVDSNLDFVSGSKLDAGGTAPLYPNTSSYYLGYAVAGQGSGGNETWYGWVELDTSAAATYPYTYQVVRYAYAKDGSAIEVGDISASAIPEPAVSAMIFGLVAIGLLGYRRLKAAKSAIARAAVAH